MFLRKRCWTASVLVVALSQQGVVACSSNESPSLPLTVDASEGGIAEKDAAAAETGVDKAAMCASTFGSSLTNAFGRIDGTLVAVVPPSYSACAQPNSDHVIVEVAFGGAVYRAVTNVLSTKGDPDVHFGKISHALPSPAFSEGWHPGVALDYVGDLALHSTSSIFSPYTKDVLAQRVADELTIGSHVSVYSTSSGGSSSHLIHRNLTDMDGAIVVAPESDSPTFLVFAFADQTF